MKQNPDQEAAVPPVGATPAQIAAAGPHMQNWWNYAGEHTNRMVAWFNDAVNVLRTSVPRVADGYHQYDDVHLDTFLLHHDPWELRWVVGNEPGPGPADPSNPLRTPPGPPAAPVRITALARAYTRTNPPPYPPVVLPAVAPPRPTPAQQQAALTALTRFIATNLDSYQTDPADPGSRIWMRLMWTFAQDEAAVRGVRWDDNLRVQGTLSHDGTGAPIPGARIEVAGAAPVTTAASGRFVLGARVLPLPSPVSVRVRLGGFRSVPQDVPSGYPGASMSATLTTLPIQVTAVVPASAAGGTAVRIDGEGFDPAATTVRFGARDAAVTAVTGARIDVTAPAGAAGAVDVTVRTAAGEFLLTGGFTYP